jgi:hypothetical protein
MMHPALVKLLKLRGRGMLRRIKRGLKKPAGILFAIFAVIMGTLWLVPAVIGSFTAPPLEPEPVRRYGPAVLLIMVIANLFNRNAQHSVHFSPAEIDVLYPAPFSRRQLLTYKVSIALLSSIGVGLLLSIFIWRYAGNWLFAAVSMSLAILLVNLLSMAAMLGGQFLAGAMRSFVQKLIAAAIGAGLVLTIVATMPIDRERGVLENIDAVLDSPIVSALLLPLSVFTEMLTAESWLIFAGFLALALVMCGGVFSINVMLDARGIEAAIERGTRYHKDMERAKKSSGIVVTYSERSARLRVSKLPWLGGAGPILHRQLTTALRSAGSLVMPVTVSLGIFGFLVAVAARESQAAAIGPAMFGVFFLAILLPQMLQFDFRGDLDQLDWLKILPIPPVPMVVGELITPVAIITVAQWILIAFTAIVAPEVSLGALIAVGAVLLPLNFLNLAIDNGMFLAYPTRKLAAGFADLAALGRNMLLFFGKAIILFVCAAAAALVALIAWWLGGGSWTAFTFAAWIVLAISCVISVPLVAKLFQQFDVSRDMPG